ncbi:KUP/HAK/KT family potassium transporter [bacterium]|nr:KUP/HAK/KT family potassium transporter [bacterium]
MGRISDPALEALGVVYDDIGTSPLNAIKERFSHSLDLSLNRDHIVGLLSLIFWSLTMVVVINFRQKTSRNPMDNC